MLFSFMSPASLLASSLVSYLSTAENLFFNHFLNQYDFFFFLKIIFLLHAFTYFGMKVIENNFAFPFPHNRNFGIIRLFVLLPENLLKIFFLKFNSLKINMIISVRVILCVSWNRLLYVMDVLKTSFKRHPWYHLPLYLSVRVILRVSWKCLMAMS